MPVTPSSHWSIRNAPHFHDHQQYSVRYQDASTPDAGPVMHASENSGQYDIGLQGFN